MKPNFKTGMVYHCYKCWPISCWIQMYQSSANGVDPDQRAPLGALWSGPALFEKDLILSIIKKNVFFFPILLHYMQKGRSCILIIQKTKLLTACVGDVDSDTRAFSHHFGTGTGTGRIGKILAWFWLKLGILYTYHNIII